MKFDYKEAKVVEIKIQKRKLKKNNGFTVFFFFIDSSHAVTRIHAYMHIYITPPTFVSSDRNMFKVSFRCM